MNRLIALLAITLVLGLASTGYAQVLGTPENFDSFGETIATGDFNADGEDDLAIGVYNEDLGSATNAGAVHILYGTTISGLGDVGTQVWTQDSPGIRDAAEANDHFGYSLAAGDFNDDGFDDLAIGAYGEGDGIVVTSGAVHVLYGTATGLSSVGDQFWHQDVPGIVEERQAGDRFGFSVTTGDFNGDGRDDLAIGVPYEDIGSAADAGFVHILYGTAIGLTATGDQGWTQFGSAIEADDNFGYTLAAGDFDNDGCDDLAIGSPFEDLDGGENAGLVNVLYGTPAGLSDTGRQTWHQDVSGISGRAEPFDLFGLSLAAGDFDGDGRDDLAIGVPLEDINAGPPTDIGLVHVLYGTLGGLSTSGSQQWTQDVAGIQGTAESGDVFGLSLAVGDFDGDGRDDLAVGVPGEGVTSSGGVSEGATQVLYGTSAGLSATGDDYWNQNLLKDQPEDIDEFGYALAAGDFDGDGRDDLAVGVPFEDLGGVINAGIVQTLYGTSTGLDNDGNQIWYQGMAAPLELTFAPIDPPAPVVIARGETGSFSASFTTGPNPPASFDYWTEAVLPNGGLKSPLVGPSSLLMNPNQTITLVFNLRIPNGAPLGDYTHRLEAGTFPGGVIDSDSYGATIVNSATADPADHEWLVYDAEGHLVEPGTTLDLRDSAQDETPETAHTPVAASETSLPDSPVLHAAYPNPFSRSATVAFELPASQRARLAVYDVLGREVAVLLDGTMEAGMHESTFEAVSLPSGVYLVRLEADGHAWTQRLTLLR